MTPRAVLILALALSLLAAPLAAGAQPAGKVWRIGYLAPHDSTTRLDAAFDTAMMVRGYKEGQNLVVERRFLRGRYDTANEAVQDVIRLSPDVIVTWAVQLTAAAKRATTTVPTVFIAVRGPVERGLVPSLGHPGGNITGLSTYAVETIDPKLFEVAKELLPQLARVAVLSSSADPPGARSARERAAQAIGVKFVPIPFSDDRDLATAPAAVERSGAQLLIAPDTPLLYLRRKEIVHFARAMRLPAVESSAHWRPAARSASTRRGRLRGRAGAQAQRPGASRPGHQRQRTGRRVAGDHRDAIVGNRHDDVLQVVLPFPRSGATGAGTCGRRLPRREAY